MLALPAVNGTSESFQSSKNAAAAAGNSEDCLSVNVVKPKTAKPGDKLPVIAWIFGGGFEVGMTSSFDGGIIVNRSIAIDEPIIFVSMNYRLAAWGFLSSQEVKDAGVGNLGLEDQRLAFRWIQQHIEAFGGDPTKVTIWGESAGAISVALQMLTNGGDTEGLFRGGFMQSGGPLPVGDITGGQPFYDALVQNTGCSGSADTLECMRGISEDTMQAAVNMSLPFTSFKTLDETWQPRADDRFLKDHPEKLVQQGSVADIAFITGNNDDEGTLFTLALLNLTTDAEVKNYWLTNYFPNANSSVIDEFGALYPEDPTQGSPFDTGTANAVTPEFKRLAAFQGDVVFQAPRRFFIQARAAQQPIWSFCWPSSFICTPASHTRSMSVNKRLKDTPTIGSSHGSDLVQNISGHAELQDYLINFVNFLDPNKKVDASLQDPRIINWPQYDDKTVPLLTILDGAVPLNITRDDYREDAINFMTEVSLEMPPLH